MDANISSTPAAQPTPANRSKHYVMTVMNLIVLVLSAGLIAWISIDTFERVNFLQNHNYMIFQFWVCVVFMIDFFVGLCYADRKWRYFGRNLLFLLLSIPVLNIVNLMDIHLSDSALYFVRFIPLARGALALSIVIGYISSNAVTSLFMSYLTIMLFIAYFCSLIFYQCEARINPEVSSYWDSLWWAMMNMTTVGCNINPATAAGKICAVVLPCAGMIIFPLFTVYLTDYVTRSLRKDDKKKENDAQDA
ncbi:MAG: two pore domain potassium channel family protein [Muribaculaceae bacterium]|nr:two pore domain potassium channel family protein [Muribaculaceae bacterium]